MHAKRDAVSGTMNVPRGLGRVGSACESGREVSPPTGMVGCCDEGCWVDEEDGRMNGWKGKRERKSASPKHSPLEEEEEGTAAPREGQDTSHAWSVWEERAAVNAQREQGVGIIFIHGFCLGIVFSSFHFFSLFLFSSLPLINQSINQSKSDQSFLLSFFQSLFPSHSFFLFRVESFFPLYPPLPSFPFLL